MALGTSQSAQAGKAGRANVEPLGPTSQTARPDEPNRRARFSPCVVGSAICRGSRVQRGELMRVGLLPMGDRVEKCECVRVCGSGPRAVSSWVWGHTLQIAGAACAGNASQGGCGFGRSVSEHATGRGAESACAFSGKFSEFCPGLGLLSSPRQKGPRLGVLGLCCSGHFPSSSSVLGRIFGKIVMVRVDGACGLLQPVSTLSGVLGWHVHVPIGMVKPPCGGWCCAALHSASAMVVMAESLLLGAFLADDEPDRRLPPCRRRCWSCSACRRRTSFSARAMRLISRW